jgi:hypothetical protein
MDNVIVEFKTGIEKLSQVDLELYKVRYAEVPHIFSKMEDTVQKKSINALLNS